MNILKKDSEFRTELDYVKELLIKVVEGQEYDSSWMRPKMLSLKQRFAEAHEALCVTEKLIEMIKLPDVENYCKNPSGKDKCGYSNKELFACISRECIYIKTKDNEKEN